MNLDDRDRAGQVWETDGGAIFLVVRSYMAAMPSWYELRHDVLILRGYTTANGPRFGHVEGQVSQGWREGSKTWEEYGSDRKRLA